MCFPLLLTSVAPCYSFAETLSDAHQKRYLREFMEELRYNYLAQRVKVNGDIIGTVVDVTSIETLHDWKLQYTIRVDGQESIFRPFYDESQITFFL